MQSRPRESSNTTADWNPRTKLGRLVKNGDITNLEEAYERKMPILEHEIIDVLVPNLQEDILDTRSVQRVMDSGRKNSFRVTVVVGNKDGYVGVGFGKGVEMRATIERAVREAKKNVIHVRRGCGHWECGCGQPHSLPFKVDGKQSSVHVELTPAPKGTGIQAGKTGTQILQMAGIRDVWTRATGSTATTLNFTLALFEALKKTRRARLEKEIGTV